MGDVNVFKANEERALALVASKFKAWGITPNNDTVRLHQEFFATSCPHRSIEIHGGFIKAYFIGIGELMNSTDKWIQDAKGWWYRYADGSYPKEQWLKLDAWYYFDSYGYALYGTSGDTKGLWYYFGDDCRMAKGWIKLDGHWYYLTQPPAHKTGGCDADRLAEDRKLLVFPASGARRRSSGGIRGDGMDPGRSVLVLPASGEKRQ